MWDIQIRNRYKKEIDILINRISILQDQEKSYEDLTSKIVTKEHKLEVLKKKEEDISQAIEKKIAVNESLAVTKIDMESEFHKIDKKLIKSKKEIENEWIRFEKQKDIYETHLTRIQNTINKNNIKLEETKNNLYTKEKEYENYKAEIKREKWDLFDKVINNEKILEEQEQKKKKIIDDINLLKGEYDEIDSDYQELLEMRCWIWKIWLNELQTRFFQQLKEQI